MKITKKYLFFLITIIGVMGFLGTVVRANEGLINTQTGMGEIGTVYNSTNSASVGPEDIRTTITKIIRVALTFIGAIFFVLTIFAGFQYMTAAGNEEQAKKALSLLKNAVIGLIIILMSWVITRYSIQILNKTVQNDPNYTQYEQ